jgi:hypothetical protein
MNIKTQNLNCEIELSKPDNEGWMQVFVYVETPGFSGKYNCTILNTEWTELIKYLDEMESSIGNIYEMNWENYEENIGIKMELNKFGQINGEYKFSPTNFTQGPILSGQFEADQTFIKIWSNEAKNEIK